MKRLIPIYTFLLILILSGFIQAACDQKMLRLSCKEMLEPYIYDSAKLTRIIYKPGPQTYSVEIPVFSGEKYRLAFNTSSLPKKVNINIYNNSAGEKKRDLLFSNKALKDDTFVFNSPKVKKLFIDYEIPPDSTNKAEGCLMLMVGYSDKTR